MKLLSLVASALGMSAATVNLDTQTTALQPALYPIRKSRGHGEGLPGNKHARSSFKQNKRRGL